MSESLAINVYQNKDSELPNYSLWFDDDGFTEDALVQLKKLIKSCDLSNIRSVVKYLHKSNRGYYQEIDRIKLVVPKRLFNVETLAVTEQSIKQVLNDCDYYVDIFLDEKTYDPYSLFDSINLQLIDDTSFLDFTNKIEITDFESDLTVNSVSELQHKVATCIKDSTFIYESADPEIIYTPNY